MPEKYHSLFNFHRWCQASIGSPLGLGRLGNLSIISWIAFHLKSVSRQRRGDPIHIWAAREFLRFGVRTEYFLHSECLRERNEIVVRFTRVRAERGRWNFDILSSSDSRFGESGLRGRYLCFGSWYCQSRPRACQL